MMVMAFSLRVRIMPHRRSSTNYSPPALFFYEVEISSRTLIPLFSGKDQSTVAQRAKMTVDKDFSDAVLSFL